jgi:hypothetical protein
MHSQHQASCYICLFGGLVYVVGLNLARRSCCCCAFLYVWWRGRGLMVVLVGVLVNLDLTNAQPARGKLASALQAVGTFE